MREAIIQQKLNQLSGNEKKNLSDKPNNSPLPLILIPIFTLLLISLVGGVIIIRKRKKMSKIR